MVVDRTNAERQRRYIQRLKERAAAGAKGTVSNATNDLEKRLTKAMARIAELEAAKPVTNAAWGPLQWRVGDSGTDGYPKATARAGSGVYVVTPAFDMPGGKFKFSGYRVYYGHPVFPNRYFLPGRHPNLAKDGVDPGEYRTLKEAQARAERDAAHHAAHSAKWFGKLGVTNADAKPVSNKTADAVTNAHELAASVEPRQIDLRAMSFEELSAAIGALQRHAEQGWQKHAQEAARGSEPQDGGGHREGAKGARRRAQAPQGSDGRYPSG